MPAVSGVDFLVKVNTGTEASPVWTTVGGQRNATLNLDSDAIDVTSKDSNGWHEEIVGISNWSIEFDGLILEDDAGYLELEEAYMNKTLVMVQLATPAGKTYTGKARITLSIEGPYDGEATVSGTLTGSGQLTKA
jgi:TP901-1 family phage major tail protein